MGDTELVSAKLDTLHNKISGLETSMQKLADAVVQIARLEVQMANNAESIKRAFDAIEKMHFVMAEHMRTSDERMKDLELAQPVQKLVSGWVLAWIAGAVGLFGGAVASTVLMK